MYTLNAASLPSHDIIAHAPPRNICAYSSLNAYGSNRLYYRAMAVADETFVRANSSGARQMSTPRVHTTLFRHYAQTCQYIIIMGTDDPIYPIRSSVFEIHHLRGSGGYKWKPCYGLSDLSLSTLCVYPVGITVTRNAFPAFPADLLPVQKSYRFLVVLCS